MRVLLINPPRSPANAILDHAPRESLPFIHRKLIGPPLGLLTIAGALEECEVSLLELKAEYDLHPDAPPPRELVREQLRVREPDIVGVTVIASEFEASLEICDEVKKRHPRALVVAGGLHATLCPVDFEGQSVDAVCIGPATRTFGQIVDAVRRNEKLDGIPGLYLNDESGYRFTGPRRENIDEAGPDFVMPRRDLVRPWLESYKVGKSPDPATYLFTSLGCPYRCSFCSIWPQYQGAYFQREVESVIEELRSLEEYPVVRFADANTLVNPDFLERLFDRIAEEGIEKFFIMDMRPDAAMESPRLIGKLARGGLKVVISGFESFRNEELKRYNKSATAAAIDEAIRVFHENDIMVRGNYVISPDYTNEDFDALERYAAANRVAYAGYTILTPMPGTPLFKKLENRIVDRDLSKYNFFNCVLETKLPLERFYERVAALWGIRRGQEVI